MSLRQYTIAAILAMASFASATEQKSPQDPVLGTDTVHGCYKSVGTMKLDSSPDFNTQGKCNEICRKKKKATAATFSNECYCGDVYPNKKDLTDDSDCTEPCPGFKDEACGGLDTWTVYNTGLRVSVGTADISSSSSSTESPTTTAADDAASTSDTIETITASSEPDSDDSGGTNKVGIAVGVVVGVLGIGGIAGAAFFWMRRKRNSEIEEEHRRNAAVNAFISGGGKPPGSSGGLSMSDSRLDPVLNRRGSDGSIADNQDYSRRILRVTNA